MVTRIRVEPGVQAAVEKLPARPEIMLDSGAYSAWFHGAPLDLNAYIDYCKHFGRLFSSIVALDKIPGANRKAAKSAADIEMAAKISHAQFNLMRKAGLKPIPVFHQGEHWSWLERMIDEGVQYVGISPYPRAGQESILKWLDEVFTRLTNAAGEPIVKTHGFGATSWYMITRYPWHSVDSTTWALAAGYGTLIFAPFGHNAIGGLVPDYRRPPMRFSISDRDTAGSRALLKQGEVTRRAVGIELDKIGLSLSEVRQSDRFRAEWNANYYVQLEASLGCTPFAFRRPDHAQGFKQLVRFDYRPRVIFAEQTGKHEYGRALQRVGAAKRLISYYESRKLSVADLESYCATGLLEKAEMPAKKRGSPAWIVNRRLGLLRRLKECSDGE